MGNTQELLEGLITELKRGATVLCVLSSLKSSQYGYSLSQALEEKGVSIDQNTLYPLLRRLEKQELLTSDWMVEDNRPRRYYILSDKGRQVLSKLTEEWEKMTQSIKTLLSEREG